MKSDEVGSRNTPVDGQTGGVSLYRPSPWRRYLSLTWCEASASADAVRYLLLITSNDQLIINRLTEWQVWVTCRPRPPLTNLFLTDEQLISSQNHEPVLPDLSEDPFTAELSDPADFIGLKVLRPRVLRTLNTRNGKQRQSGYVTVATCAFSSLLSFFCLFSCCHHNLYESEFLVFTKFFSFYDWTETQVWHLIKIIINKIHMDAIIIWYNTQMQYKWINIHSITIKYV